MAVRVEKTGPVTTVILDRPEVRNAVDRAHADALADGVSRLRGRRRRAASPCCSATAARSAPAPI